MAKLFIVLAAIFSLVVSSAVKVDETKDSQGSSVLLEKPKIDQDSKPPSDENQELPTRYIEYPSDFGIFPDEDSKDEFNPVPTLSVNGQILDPTEISKTLKSFGLDSLADGLFDMDPLEDMFKKLPHAHPKLIMTKYSKHIPAKFEKIESDDKQNGNLKSNDMNAALNDLINDDFEKIMQKFHFGPRENFDGMDQNYAGLPIFNSLSQGTKKKSFEKADSRKSTPFDDFVNDVSKMFLEGPKMGFVGDLSNFTQEQAPDGSYSTIPVFQDFPYGSGVYQVDFDDQFDYLNPDEEVNAGNFLFSNRPEFRDAIIEYCKFFDRVTFFGMVVTLTIITIVILVIMFKFCCSCCSSSHRYARLNEARTQLIENKDDDDSILVNLQ